MKVYKLFHEPSETYLSTTGHFTNRGDAYEFDTLVEVIQRNQKSQATSPSLLEEYNALVLVEYENKTRTVICTVRELKSYLRDKRINSLFGVSS